MEKVRKAIFMFSDLFGLERYNYNKLVTPTHSEYAWLSVGYVLLGEFPDHREVQLQECGLP